MRKRSYYVVICGCYRQLRIVNDVATCGDCHRTFHVEWPERERRERTA